MSQSQSRYNLRSGQRSKVNGPKKEQGQPQAKNWGKTKDRNGKERRLLFFFLKKKTFKLY